MNLFKTKTAEVFYARHITHGISKYKAGNVLITKPVLDKMNDSFSGKPVVITHDQWEKQEPVGYVVKSFYLPQDGYFWVEFIISDKKALDFIKNQKFRVSNGYLTTASGVGGTFHDIDYVEEVLDGEYVHLALTNRPKFDEAIIMNKDEFKDFRNNLEKIDNKFNEREEKMAFEFFKRSKVSNSQEILDASFELEGKEFTVKSMIETLKVKLNEGEKKYAACGGEYTAEELVAKCNELSDKLNEKTDKRKDIDEIGGMLKDKIDEELWRTIIGKIEKVAYNSSNEEEEKREAEKKAEEAKKAEEEKAKKEAEEKAKKEAEEKEAAEKAKQNEKLNSRMNVGNPEKPARRITFQATKDGGIKIIEEQGE